MPFLLEIAVVVLGLRWMVSGSCCRGRGKFTVGKVSNLKGRGRPGVTVVRGVVVNSGDGL